jgi:hypothetical protein
MQVFSVNDGPVTILLDTEGNSASSATDERATGPARTTVDDKEGFLTL